MQDLSGKNGPGQGEGGWGGEVCGEGAAYGADLQALWCWRGQRGERVKINDITAQFVRLNKSEAAHPSRHAVPLYRELQSMQDELSLALRPVFLRHRKFAA